ncbi:dihydrolipoyl dehydrogenase [Candidatus Micrarchaeota archaeon]|nr:dihydrolipoyl dehydrogenase [Candidatus Micrarchaeota archaeon]
MVMGQLTTNVDVAVIGAGPGGYTAAIRAAQLGLEVILIEKERLGGVCTNVGCIPSKALIHAADVKYEAEFENAKNMGIHADIRVDFPQMQKWKDGVVSDLRNGITTLCKLNGVDVLKGTAFFTSSNTMDVETETGMRVVQFKKAVIATGTKIKEHPTIICDHKSIINSNDVFSLNEIPKKLIVVGGGYIAVEMANMFMKFGSKVTIVYRGDRLLKRMEPEITHVLLKKIGEMGGEVLFNSEVQSVSGNTATIKIPEGEKKLEFDKMLMAMGRVTAVDALALVKTKIEVNREGLIEIDQTCRTADESIYAIGDITPGPQLAHKAFRQGKVAAEAIAGMKSVFDNRAIPMVVFSDPEIATVGLTEGEAKEQGYKLKIGKMPFSALGKARAINRTEGFVKIVADENGIVLGMHIVGAGAANLIAEGSLAVEMSATLEDLAVTIHAHPTLPEAVAEGAEDALGHAIHLYRGKR